MVTVEKNYKKNERHLVYWMAIKNLYVLEIVKYY